MIHNQPMKRRSFDGGLTYKKDGPWIDCNCVNCKESRKDSLTKHIAKELPAYLKQRKAKS